MRQVAEERLTREAHLEMCAQVNLLDTQACDPLLLTR